MFDAYWFANLATAKLLTGELQAAYKIAQSALAGSSLTNNKFWDVELHRICVEGLRLSSDGDGVTEHGAERYGRGKDNRKSTLTGHYQQAVSIAQRQGAGNLLQRLVEDPTLTFDAPDGPLDVLFDRHAARH